MSDGVGTCPYRGTECKKENCSHFDTAASICIISQGTLVANDALIEIRDLLAKYLPEILTAIDKKPK